MKKPNEDTIAAFVGLLVALIINRYPEYVTYSESLTVIIGILVGLVFARTGLERLNFTRTLSVELTRLSNQTQFTQFVAKEGANAVKSAIKEIEKKAKVELLDEEKLAKEFEAAVVQAFSKFAR